MGWVTVDVQNLSCQSSITRISNTLSLFRAAILATHPGERVDSAYLSGRSPVNT